MKGPANDRRNRRAEAQNKKLEHELTLQKAGDDPRKRALLAAGVPLDRLADASKVFRPSGNTTTGVFRLDDVTGDLDSLAREWLLTRPWFGNPEPAITATPDDRARIEDGRAIFPDGSSLDVDLMSTDDLFSMAGEAPKVKAPEPKPDADADYLPDVDKEWRAAGPFPGKKAS